MLKESQHIVLFSNHLCLVETCRNSNLKASCYQNTPSISKSPLNCCLCYYQISCQWLNVHQFGNGSHFHYLPINVMINSVIIMPVSLVGLQ